MADKPFDADAYTKPFNLTKTYHRSVYPAIDVTNPLNSAAGKTILITGGSRGLGRAIAISYAAAGAAGIIVTARKLEDLEDVKAKVSEASGGKTEVLPVAVEVTKPGDVEKVFVKAKEKFGKLDVVVANAGAMGGGGLKIGDLDPSIWWKDLVRSASCLSHSRYSSQADVGNVMLCRRSISAASSSQHTTTSKRSGPREPSSTSPLAPRLSHSRESPPTTLRKRA